MEYPGGPMEYPGGPTGHPGGGPAPGPYVPAWEPPTDVEAALYGAKARQDWAAYYDTLGDTWLCYSLPRGPLDALGQRDMYPYWSTVTGTWCFAVLTQGMLPAPVADPVFVRTTLDNLAASWPDDRWWLAVNPGSPCEAYFPGTLPVRTVWRHHADRAWRGQRDTLRTLRVGGPLHGPVAHGLACGALHCVRDGSLWNAMGWHGSGYDGERERIRGPWDVHGRDDWRCRQEQLLNGAMSDPDWEFVLAVRRSLHDETDGTEEGEDTGTDRTGPAAALRWRAATERAARAEEGGEGGDPDGSGAEARVKRLQQLIGRIMRYESRFRADGLLPPDGTVRSVRAWDYGLASMMARWGLGGRYCDMAEAERAVVRAGEVSKEAYESWEEFSLGYVLGRCLHFDEERYDDWYTDMVTAHRILTTDPGSPWLNIPFK
ncbi:DUF1266 domain-containing protein [Streptomyces daliensis]